MARLRGNALTALKLVRTYVSADDQQAKAAALAELASLLSSASWLGSIKAVSVSEDGEEVTVSYARPNAPEEDASEEPTPRTYDVEAFLIQLVLLSFGGSTHIDPKEGENYYPRLTIRDVRGGRPLVLRLIADTLEQQLTTEPEDYHDLRVSALKGFFAIDREARPDRGQTGAFVGRAEAKAALLANYDDCKKAGSGTNSKKAADAIKKTELEGLLDTLFAMLDERKEREMS